MAQRLYDLVRTDPASPEFDIVGARPGERLAEELVSISEQLISRVEEPLSMIVDTCAAEHHAKVEEMVDELRALLESGHSEALRERLMTMAHALQ
jgi:FlaA1/EpsC-like NDP-sugar epimerase